MTDEKQTEILSGGQMIARALEDEGVEFIFGYPGGAVLHIYDALHTHSKIPHILVRHEQAATHAADGYTRATGKTGLVLVTSGPGATNAITGIATAYMDSIPMVVLSGQVQSHLIGGDAFQETDMVGISRPIVKHSFLVQSTEEIPETIKKAFYLAASGRPGPVVIDLPKDITNPTDKYEYNYPKKIKLRSYTPAARGHSGQIRKAVNLIKEAKRPVLYAGGGVIQGNGSELLTELAHELKFPVTTTLMGLGGFPSSDPQWLGMLGMHGTFEANNAMHHSDLIVCIGARFDDRTTNTPSKYCPTAKIVHIDIDPASISKTIKADIPIVGPVDNVLKEMLTQISELKAKEQFNLDTDALDNWWQMIDQWRDEFGIYTKDRFTINENGLLKQQQVIQCLHKLTKDDDFYLASDVGQHQMFAAQYYKFDKPRRWLNSGGLGTMGFGLPAAMGAKLAFPDATVGCVTGEGSIQMNIQELSTCTQYNLPVKIFNLNNQSLGMVRQWQEMMYDSRLSASVSYKDSLPDFVKLVEAYGHVGIVVKHANELEEKMKEALSLKDRLVFMDIYCDTKEHVYPMLSTPGSMRDMQLSKTEWTK
ncbi:acetolactate synthase large subunit [Sinobacterium caligoides]|uniref:Acetolactate synthase n=1 Tax=Sinobacterium caligoides TaxID=933926 RepID=A0A3N2E115_9GAMM|nr:acetolactate synthase 3 large subunit [Sinobacterium caligoides]ROS05798.1 acetolactate synthase large subunit [Sinobacterium caligoides]